MSATAGEGIDTSYISLQREALRVADEQIENLRYQIRLLEETLASSTSLEDSSRPAVLTSSSTSPLSPPPTIPPQTRINTSPSSSGSGNSRSTTSFPPAFTSPDTSLRLWGLAEELSRQTARVNPPGSDLEGEEEKEEEVVRVLSRRSQGEGGGGGRGRGEVDYNQVRSGSLLEEEVVNNRSRPRPPPQESYSIESEHVHGYEFEDDQDHEPGYPFVPEPLEQPLEENEVSPSDVESARLEMEAWRVEREAWNLEVLEGMYLEKIHRQATLQDGDQAGIRNPSTGPSSSTIRKSRSAKSRSEDVIRERERERERVFELRLVLGIGDGNGDNVRVSSCLKGERPGR